MSSCLCVPCACVLASTHTLVAHIVCHETHILSAFTEHSCAWACAVPRLFTPEIAAFYEGYWAHKGVTINKGTVVTGFTTTDDGHVRRCPPVSCCLRCSLVLVGRELTN